VKLSNAKSGSSSRTGWNDIPAFLPADSCSPHRSISGITGTLKRSIDCILAGAGLIILAPLLAVIAAVVRLTDGGPIFYRQTRVGFCGCPFTIIKFRTMAEDAERHLGPIWAVPHDPRCTRIGYYLRRLGLDELPQLWNVLRGDMSLVGPRPERPEFTGEFGRELPEYSGRQIVQPGLTGYAQVHGWRGYTSLEQRLRHDLYYINNWSFGLDVYILLMTIIRGWSERTRNGVKY
jgi:exopolysaccharide biosynthesis polyprenyl glycosylphosphotransferase